MAYCRNPTSNSCRITNMDPTALCFHPESVPKSHNSNPWGDWTLDEGFLRALIRWTIDNPETSLDRLLANMCIAMDDKRSLINMIPDSPFPARSFFYALCSLIELGTVRPSLGHGCDAALNTGVAIL